MVQWDNEEITLWCRINEEITCGKWCSINEEITLW
jgi:hypothetical protein